MFRTNMWNFGFEGCWITAVQLKNWLEICANALPCSKKWSILQHILLISEWIAFESLPNRYVTNSFYLFASLPGNLTFLFHGVFFSCVLVLALLNESKNKVPVLFLFAWHQKYWRKRNPSKTNTACKAQCSVYMFDGFVYEFFNLISCEKEVGVKNYVCRTVVKFAQHQQNPFALIFNLN